MEHGFQKTSMGQQAYAMNLAIITQAVLRTVYARCMQVLVQQRNFLSVVHAQNFATEYAKSREISKASTHVFGCLQKNTFGFDNCLASVMKLFENRQLAAPDAVVIPHGSFGVLKMCKPESRTFAICGDLAQRLDMSPTRDFISNIYNNQFQIFEHRPMSISQDSNEINMLTRHRDVGNVFRIFRDTESYSSQQLVDRMHTATKIVDHDKQRWRTITLVDALEKSGAFDDNGQMKQDVLNTICEKNDVKPGEATFGDIKKKYLKQMIKDVERSLNTFESDSFPAVSKSRIASRIGSSVQRSAESLPEATVNEVASAILGAAVGSSPVAEQPDVVASARDLAKATSNLGGPMRGAIVGILENSDAMSQFSKSRKVMKAIGKNKDASKAVELKDKLTAAMGEDFTSGWTTISRNARENLASMQDRVQSASYAAAPIGAATAGNLGYGTEENSMMNTWLRTQITLKNISILDHAGVLTPFGAYVFRPFQSFEMGSMVVMKAGRDTGMTVVGNSDFQLVSTFYYLFRRVGRTANCLYFIGRFGYQQDTSWPLYVLFRKRRSRAQSYHGGSRCNVYALQRRRRWQVPRLEREYLDQ